MKSLKSNLPRWIFLQLLEGCNLRCKMCYEWGSNGAYHEKDKLAVLDINVVKKIVKDCKHLSPHYELFGGEPLLYPQIEEVLTEIKHGGSSVDIPTNGTTLVKDAEMLVRTGPDKLWVSLDGPERINDSQRGKGVYKKVLAGIDKVYEVRKRENKTFPHIGIGTTVTPDNYKYLTELFLECLDLKKIDHISLEMQTYTTIERLKEYGNILKTEFEIESTSHAGGYLADKDTFKDIDTRILCQQIEMIEKKCKEMNILLNIYPKIINQDNLDKYFSANWPGMQGSKKRCVFPWITAEINARGEVASCHSLYDLTYGNLYQNSLEDIWNNEMYNNFRKIMKKQLLPICPACCLYYNEKLTGR